MVVYVATPLGARRDRRRATGEPCCGSRRCRGCSHLLRRGAGLETADPSATADRPGRRRGAGRPAAPHSRHRLRGARAGADGGIRAGRDRAVRRRPGCVVALATLLVGGSWRVAGWMTACTVVAAVLALAAQPAMGVGVDVGRLSPAPDPPAPAAARRPSWRRSAPDRSGSACWHWRCTCRCSRRWRSRARGGSPGAPAVPRWRSAFGSLMLLADRDALGFAVPRTAAARGSDRTRPGAQRGGTGGRLRRATC